MRRLKEKSSDCPGPAVPHSNTGFCPGPSQSSRSTCVSGRLALEQGGGSCPLCRCPLCPGDPGLVIMQASSLSLALWCPNTVLCLCCFSCRILRLSLSSDTWWRIPSKVKPDVEGGLVSTKGCICSALGCTSRGGCIYLSFKPDPAPQGELRASTFLTK